MTSQLTSCEGRPVVHESPPLTKTLPQVLKCSPYHHIRASKGEGLPKTYGHCPTRFSGFLAQQRSRGLDPWAPFASREEWELARWIHKSNLSQRATDEFLKGSMVCRNQTQPSLESLPSCAVTSSVRREAHSHRNTTTSTTINHTSVLCRTAFLVRRQLGPIPRLPSLGTFAMHAEG